MTPPGPVWTLGLECGTFIIIHSFVWFQCACRHSHSCDNENCLLGCDAALFGRHIIIPQDINDHEVIDIHLMQYFL